MAAPHYSAAAGAPAGGSGVQLAQLNDEKALLLADGKPIAKPFTKAQASHSGWGPWQAAPACRRGARPGCNMSVKKKGNT